MLEHLGLGIVLEMEDNFTPQANTALNSFERLQSGAESMQQNVGRSLSNLQNLMLSGFSLNTIGDSFQQAGGKILSVFENLGKNFVKVNADYQTLQSQMVTSFKGNAQEAQKAFDWVRSYSAQTPFETQGLTDAFAKMKSTNMDLRDTFKMTNGEVKSFAEAMGDLATRNMGATGGMSNMGYAIQNAWAGQAKSLYDRFNFGKQEMDSMMQYAGKDSKKFMEEFVKMAEKLAPDAMKNMGGTWNQTMSNMDDMWNNFLYDMGKTGIFNKINESLDYVQKRLNSVFGDPEAVKAFGQILDSLWRPVEMVAKGLANIVVGILNFAKAHPMIAQIATGFVALNGVLLVLTGTIMKLFGSTLILVTSLVSAWANLKVLGSLGLASEIGGVTAGLSSIVSWLGIAGASIGAFALAWHNNFMGIRDRGMTIIGQLKEAWANSGMYLDKDFSTKYKKQIQMDLKLDTDGSFKKMNDLSYKIAQFRALGMGLFKSLFGAKDKNGNVMFTDEEIQAFKNTGMLETVQRLVMLRGRVEAFFKGFGEGIGTAIEMSKNFIGFVLTPINAVLGAIGIQLPRIGKWFADLFGLDLPMDRERGLRQIQMWENIGKAIGAVVGVVLGFKIIKGLSNIITSPFVKLFDTLMGVKGALTDVGSKFGLFGGKKTLEVESKVHKKVDTTTGQGTSKKPTFKQWLFGRREDGQYNSDVAKEYYDKHTRNANLGYTVNGKYHDQRKAQREGKYNRVYSNQLDSSYSTYKLNEDGINTNQLYTDRKPAFWKRMFGDKFYSKDAQGNMQRAGQFGGYFNVDSYDNQLRLASQRYTERGNIINRGRPEDYARQKIGYHKVNKNGSLGELVDFDFKNQYSQYTTDRNGNQVVSKDWTRRQKEIERVQANISSGKYKTAYSKSRIGELLNMRSHILDTDDQVGTVRSLFGAQSNQGNYRTLQRQHNQAFNQARQDLGIDMRRFNIGAGESEESANRKRALKERALQQIRNHPAVLASQARLDAEHTRNSQAVFKANRSKMGEFLFGQRFYKVDRDADGNLFENTVARRGGVFRRGNDLRYNEEGDTSLRARARGIGTNIRSRVMTSNPVIGARMAYENTRDRILTSNPVIGARMAYNSARTGIRNTRLAVGMRVGMFQNQLASEMSQTSLGRGLLSVGRVVSRPMTAINNQRRRLGWDTIGFRSSTDDNGNRRDGLARRVGRGLFGRSSLNPDTGERVGGGVFSRVGRGLFGRARVDEETGMRTGGGLFSRAGRMAKGVGGTLGRGVGFLGKGAMMAMPMVGGALSLGKMAFGAISAKGGGNFNAGLKEYQKQIKAMDFSAMYNKLKTQGKEAWKIIGQIGKDVWEKLKPELPKIMGEAFQGIKGLAQIAWAWISTNGIKLLGQVATNAMSLLGKAFSWVGDNAGKIFGAIAQFVIGTVLPKLIEGIVALGAFIIKHIPDAIKIAVQVAGGLFSGLLTIVQGIFSGIASFLWNAITGAFRGIGSFFKTMIADFVRSALPSALASPVLSAMGVHHKGLWMSQDEHPAIIRKDETVLPPEISRKFNSLLKDMGGSSKASSQSQSSGGGSVDNSVKIDKVEIHVQAEKLSRADARDQAKMILEELKKMNNEHTIRQFA